MPIRRHVLLAPALLGAGHARAAGEVQLAVASNFAQPMQALAAAFHAAGGHRVRVSIGSTGQFHAQILAGAPFDALLAADEQTPARLIASGHAVAGSAFTYAVGRLVLWSARAGWVDADGAVLASPGLRRLAIANPRVAPYGAAAMQVLQSRGLVDALRARLVTAESIAQAYQFVASGNADAGFVALAQLLVPGREAGGSSWRVPASLHAPIRQGAVLLRRGQHKPAALALLDWLRGADARERMRAFGYET